MIGFIFEVSKKNTYAYSDPGGEIASSPYFIGIGNLKLPF